MITSPHTLNAEFERVDQIYQRLEPKQNVDEQLQKNIGSLVGRWSSIYYSEDWGYSRIKGKTWLASQQDTWNAALLTYKQLVDRASKSPGVKLMPVGGTQLGPVEVRGKVPWWWVGMPMALILLYTLIFSKKRAAFNEMDDDEPII